jgi:hypothetical protein
VTADVSSSYVRSPLEAKVVRQSALFTELVERLAAGDDVPPLEWRRAMTVIANLWGMTPCDASYRSIGNTVRDVADQVRDFRRAAEQ